MSERVRFRDLFEAREVLSEAELRFERRRRTVGLGLGPLVFLALLLLPIPALPIPAARLAAVLAWVLTWWITEAVPIPVTALLGPALAVVCGVGTAGELFASLRRPDHLPLPRQLHHRRGDVRQRPRPPPRVRDSRATLGRLVLEPHLARLHRHLRRTVDVAVQHRDHGDDLPDRDERAAGAVTASRGGPRREGRFHQAALRHGAHAGHGVRLVDRRHRHAGRHAAEPHRRRPARRPGRDQGHLLPVDADRHAGRARHARGARAAPAPGAAPRGAADRRQPRAHHARAGPARPGLPRRAQRPGRLWPRRRSLGRPRNPRPVPRGEGAARRRHRPALARGRRGPARRWPAVRPPGRLEGSVSSP